MNVFICFIIAVALVWFIAWHGKERARREKLRNKVEVLQSSLVASTDQLVELGDANLRLRSRLDDLESNVRQAVTPEAFDTLTKAHLDLVERHACLARKTETLPG